MIFGWKVRHTLPTIQHAIHMIKSCDYNVKIASIDIQNAYRNFRSCPLDWSYLCINYDGNTYLDIALPFGTRMSSVYMQRIAWFIVRHLHKHGILCILYLDDILLAHRSDESPFEQFAYVVSTLRHLGLPISYHKLVDPCFSLTWLGFVIDIDERTISIPETKILGLRTVIEDLYHSKHLSLRSLQSLVGKVIHISQVIPCARLFIARLTANNRRSGA